MPNPSCGAWKPLCKVTYSVCTVMTSSPSACPSARRKIIIMRLNLTMSCIPKNILPVLLNKELYCTLIPLEKREQPQLWVWLITDPDCYRWQTNCLRKICEVSSFFSGCYCIYESKILLRKKQRFLLTDTRNKIIKSFLRKDRVFQPSEIELQYSSNWVNVMVTLVICQRIFTLKSK